MTNESIAELLRLDVLNLGCGRKHLSGAINLDVTAATNPDIVHNLNIRPWPFPENHFREIHAYDVIEHLNDLIFSVEEMHRISRSGAIIRITVPHFSSANAFTDPTHTHFFSASSFNYFTNASELSFYSKARFVIRSNRIFFYPTLMNKLIWRIANRRPDLYERRWAWIFPAWFIQFELEVIK